MDEMHAQEEKVNLNSDKRLLLNADDFPPDPGEPHLRHTGVSTTTNTICIRASNVQTAQQRIISIIDLLSVLCSRKVLLQLKLDVGRYDHDVVGAVNIRRVLYHYWHNPGMVRHSHFLAVG
jgi:hypothetical protein